MSERRGVVFYGLGPVGRAIAREALRRGELTVVGAVDRDPALCGRDLGELLEIEPVGVEIGADSAALLAASRPAVVLLSTASSVERILPQVLEILATGASIVTTCEELSYPWDEHPALAGEIDRAAREAAATVLSTGVNPGFVMDFLPVALSGVCREIDRVEVERRMDATPRRRSFRDKIGAGSTVEEFARRVAAGTLRHVGLAESTRMIAAALGWKLGRVVETIEPVVAGERIDTESGPVEAGRVAGVEQIARGLDGDRERVTLVFRAAVGQREPHDRVLIEATPRIDLRIAGGVQGDLATCNLVVNAVPTVLAGEPGLKTMLDLPVVAGR